jgi:hypothetical protein
VSRSLRRRTIAALLAVVVVICAASGSSVAAAQIRNYDLGVVELPDAGPKGPIPIRLWGAIGVPDGPGPYPLVVVAHGRHGDDCPHTPKFVFKWPCWDRELRTDLGMRHLVAALARRGVAAIAPDLNGAFTIGWNDRSGNRHRKLWPAVVDRTLAELGTSAAAGDGRFGLPLAGRVDVAEPGLLAHSLSGDEAARYADAHPVSALLLLAPAFNGAPLPDVATAIVAAGCDYDVPGEAHRYLQRAEHSARRQPIFYASLDGASHNYFNSTLSRLGRDDGRYLARSKGCRPLERLTASRQQGWIDRFAAAFFATGLRGASAPRWMAPAGAVPKRIYGLPVAFERFLP